MSSLLQRIDKSLQEGAIQINEAINKATKEANIAAEKFLKKVINPLKLEANLRIMSD
jgi:hypothetical protein